MRQKKRRSKIFFVSFTFFPFKLSFSLVENVFSWFFLKIIYSAVLLWILTLWTDYFFRRQSFCPTVIVNNCQIIGSVTSPWSNLSDTVRWMACWSVCHIFLKGREFSLPWSYRNTKIFIHFFYLLNLSASFSNSWLLKSNSYIVRTSALWSH